MVTTRTKSVGSPTIEYESMSRLWKRSRAILGGELAAKRHDAQIDLMNYENLLIPFSSRMSPEQYRWYVAESELPGLTSQFAKILLGGLLRKEPAVQLPATAPEGAEEWLRDDFSRDNGSMIGFLDEVVQEELSTYGGAISVDFPTVDNYEELEVEERAALAPYPILWKAEDIINRQVGRDSRTGKQALLRVVFRYMEKDFASNEHHPMYVETILDCHMQGSTYVVDKYQAQATESVVANDGEAKSFDLDFMLSGDSKDWTRVSSVVPKMHGEPLNRIPVFFTNGSMDYQMPILTPLVDREIALYNKVSRRNHLLYGAATYTPVIKTSMPDDRFDEIVARGLGSWIRLDPEDSVDVLKTPTEPLKDMDRAIEAAVAEMSRLGIRIMSPEGSQGDSGIALEIRNSSQTAQLAVLNTRISQTMTEVVKLMLEWRYGEGDWSDVEFTLSADFNPAPMGKEWMRLLTEWYESRLIPRSAFIKMAKYHDLLPPEYNDEEGIEEISQDELVAADPTMAIEE